MAAFPFSGTPLAGTALALFTMSQRTRINKCVVVNPTGSPGTVKFWLVPTGQERSDHPHLVSAQKALPATSTIIIFELALLMLPSEGGTLWTEISIGDCNVHGSASTL